MATAAEVRVDRSTLPLSELARHVVYPTGIVDSVWYDLAPRFDEWGIRWSRWQDGAGQLTLGLRADGKYASTVGGVSWSIPRQVAKTFQAGRTCFGLATQYDDMTILWTAHRIRTATQTFQKLAGFAQRKAVKRYLRVDRSDGIRAANGEQEIRFRNGSRILFGAREQGFGRGFDEVDVEVFDEAQILTERALDDMVPATNQSRNPHGALLLFMGTPPRPGVDPGDVFRDRRRRALDGKPADAVMFERGDAMYLEFSADPNVGTPGGPALDDEAQIAKANPSYPHRTPPESIARMRANLGSDESWRREALGVWDEDDVGTGAIDADAWSSHRGTLVAPVGPVVLAADTSLDRKLSALLAVGAGEDRVPQLRTVRAGAGSMWLPELVVRVCREHPEVEAIVIDDKKSTEPIAEAVTAALDNAGLQVQIVRTSYPDMAEACAKTFDVIHEGTLRHGADPMLDAAVRSAVKKEIEGSFVWSRQRSGAAVVPLVAASLALWEWLRRTDDEYDVLDSVL